MLAPLVRREDCVFYLAQVLAQTLERHLASQQLERMNLFDPLLLLLLAGGEEEEAQDSR